VSFQHGKFGKKISARGYKNWTIVTKFLKIKIISKLFLGHKKNNEKTQTEQTNKQSKTKQKQNPTNKFNGRVNKVGCHVINRVV